MWLCLDFRQGLSRIFAIPIHFFIDYKNSNPWPIKSAVKVWVVLWCQAPLRYYHGIEVVIELNGKSLLFFQKLVQNSPSISIYYNLTIWFRSKVVYGEAVMCRWSQQLLQLYDIYFFFAHNSTILLVFKEPNYKLTWRSLLQCFHPRGTENGGNCNTLPLLKELFLLLLFLFSFEQIDIDKYLYLFIIIIFKIGK